jgi:hypothetical protein
MSSNFEILSVKLQAMLIQFLNMAEAVGAQGKAKRSPRQTSSNQDLNTITEWLRAAFVNSIYVNRYGHYHIDENPLHVHHSFAKTTLGLISLAERQNQDLISYIKNALESADDESIRSFIKETNSFKSYVIILTEQVLAQIKAEPSSLLKEPGQPLFHRKAE